MTNKGKNILIITGLIVCIIIIILANIETSDRKNETTYIINPPTRASQVFVNTGAKWIIQATYKLLKPIQ
jgi:hypothetical protein